MTESIFAVGAGDRLVGDTTYCNYPEAAKSIQKVGDTLNPNIETIVALKPDVVFVSGASQLRDIYEDSGPKRDCRLCDGCDNLDAVLQRSGTTRDHVRDNR